MPITKNSSPKRRAGNYLDRTLANFVRKTERALFAEEIALRKDGFLQKIDPRVKIIGFLILIIDTTLAKNFTAIIFIFLTAVALAAVSQISLKTLAKRAWFGVLAFTGIIALPMIFITSGEKLFETPWLNLVVTKQGIGGALFLVGRVETTVTLTLILILTTLWTYLLKSLRVLRVPSVLVLILGMTYRYLFVILETAQNMLEARKSRLIAPFSGKESRRLAIANAGNLLSKSIYLNNEIYLAMRSRGFRGEIYLLDDFQMQKRDWLMLIFFLTIAGFAFWLGRQN